VNHIVLKCAIHVTNELRGLLNIVKVSFFYLLVVLFSLILFEAYFFIT